MTRRARAAGAALTTSVLAGFLVAAFVGGATAASTRSMVVEDNYFARRGALARNPTIRIDRGDTVVWRWGARNGNPHNVTFTSQPRRAARRNSTTQVRGPSFRRTFSRAGTYRYVCTIHDDSDRMRGRVIVE